VPPFIGQSGEARGRGGEAMGQGIVLRRGAEEATLGFDLVAWEVSLWCTARRRVKGGGM
jgi:hypothetical protein